MQGVTVDLLRVFAATLKLPLELQVYENSGQVTDAVAGGACDLAFMPRDAAREARVDFGPAYYLISSTYLVPAGSTIQTIDEVNRPSVRIVAIANTTTARSARRTAPNASLEEVPSVDVMTEMAATGKGDAFALSHNSFAGLLPKLPGARVLAGHFQQTGIAVAVPKGASGRAQARDRTARKCRKSQVWSAARSMPRASRTPRWRHSRRRRRASANSAALRSLSAARALNSPASFWCCSSVSAKWR